MTARPSLQRRWRSQNCLYSANTRDGVRAASRRDPFKKVLVMKAAKLSPQTFCNFSGEFSWPRRTV